MLGKSGFKQVGLSMLAIAVVLSLGALSAEAQTKPFKIRGEGVGPDGLPLPGQAPRTHWIEGNATHLGRHYGEGSVQTDTADLSNFPFSITGTFGSGSPFVFIGANGDQLVTEYGRGTNAGTYTLAILDFLPDGTLLVEAEWIAEFVVQPDDSTGKFAGATGSWIMYAFSEPFALDIFDLYEDDDPVPYHWEGEGKITFAHPND